MNNFDNVRDFWTRFPLMVIGSSPCSSIMVLPMNVVLSSRNRHYSAKHSSNMRILLNRQTEYSFIFTLLGRIP